MQRKSPFTLNALFINGKSRFVKGLFLRYYLLNSYPPVNIHPTFTLTGHLRKLALA